ncbi:uncharacterized protein LOC101850913 [Aplysia californica]|uniref:Uncharacterized protein LOC101850913 n=1 Tax=Aplysia californica TaxID=6500 RepID=A0ABM1ABD3_APLCA|nr:uncharacterized protein LOC101850913 [Aplysia californica]
MSSKLPVESSIICLLSKSSMILTTAIVLSVSVHRDSIGDTVRVVAPYHSTKIHAILSNESIRFQLNSGQYMSRIIDEPFIHITSNRPIIVVKFSSNPGYPTMTYISPTALYSNAPKIFVPYEASLFSSPTVNVVVITKTKYLGCLKVENAINTEQHNMKITDYVILYYEVSASLAQPLLVICDDTTLKAHAQFAVYLYVNDILSTLQMSTAPGSGIINPACQITAQTPGDGVDNNCNGHADEDLCDSTNVNANADCGPVISDDRDSYGLEFTFLVPQVTKPSDTTEDDSVSLLVTKRSDSVVDFTVSTPLGSFSNNYVLAAGINSQTVGLPGYIYAEGSQTISDRTLRVVATGEVTVILVANLVTGSDPTAMSARLLPDDAQGHEYYAVSVCSRNECQIQVGFTLRGMPIGLIV